eukprot:TRINITY_DN52538_c0_g1_i1.p1 TRINITY_DN52538_c0_g1~~TRINITY_DN52538_c0_g1_i1.p1  ORF type:complete len:163 (+),score=39.95 TRINITY_DN52538_c0_g1_i1:55-489(+)
MGVNTHADTLDAEEHVTPRDTPTATHRGGDGEHEAALPRHSIDAGEYEMKIRSYADNDDRMRSLFNLFDGQKGYINQEDLYVAASVLGIQTDDAVMREMMAMALPEETADAPANSEPQLPRIGFADFQNLTKELLRKGKDSKRR